MIEKIGLQTFTIRSSLKTKNDIEESLCYYADKGIKKFELSRIKFDRDELEILKKLKREQGIKYSACQITLGKILKHFTFLMEFCNELNIQYLEVSVIPTKNFLKKRKGIEGLSRDLNELGKRTKKYGVSLLYHHHNYELIKFDNQLSLDVLLDNTDAEYVNIVCDTYWIARSGYNPSQFISDRINRIKGVHLRDNLFYYNMGKFKCSDTVIGEGTIDFKSIVELDAKGHIDFYSIEQDSKNPREDVITSYKHIKGLINR